MLLHHLLSIVEVILDFLLSELGESLIVERRLLLLGIVVGVLVHHVLEIVIVHLLLL